MNETTQNSNGNDPVDNDASTMDSASESISSEMDQESLVQELEDAQQKISDFQDRILRMQAEMENLRKRTERDLSNAHKYGIEKFAGELLQVKDSLELGLGASDVDLAKLQEGTELTLKMLTAVLKKFSIEEINALGEAFDPNLHEAMTLQESAEYSPNKVINVMQKGYTLNDRLLRPAMVIVAKAPEAATDD
ncbi:MAG: nucleotide exchange factor GrpE [Gammaproteobacteria bacterium]